MKSQLLIVLGISSFLLGLYILVISLFNLQQRADYHIGCYLSNTTNDNAFQFRTRLQALKARGSNSRNLNTQIRTTDLVDPHLRQKSVNLTRNVDSYIQKISLIKKYQQENMDFFVQLSKARQSYEGCVAQLRSNIDIDNSKSLWSEYKGCFDKYQELKDDVQRLYSKRNKYIDQIDSLLVYDPSVNPNFDFQAELKKIKERYERQNAQNDENKANNIAQLKRLQHKNQTKSSEHDQNERQFTRADLQYKICLKNLKEFKKCEDIAKALRDYGYVESVEALEDRIISKRQILVQLRQLVLESRQSGGNNEAITKMYAKREKQLIQTIKLRLHMGYDEMKECGCTEENRRRLESEYQSAKMKLNSNKKEINDLIFQIYTVERKIKETDQLRERLINQFTEQTERLRNRETSNILTLKQRLELLRSNLTVVNQEISQFDRKLNSLEFQCNQYKDRLVLRLPDSEKVTDCQKNKDFYEQLKSKAQLILSKGDESSLTSRDSVRNSLSAIIYPETTKLRQIIEEGRAITEISQTQPHVQNVSEHSSEPRLEKQVITIHRQIKIESPEEKITIQQEQIITIEPVHSNEL